MNSDNSSQWMKQSHLKKFTIYISNINLTNNIKTSIQNSNTKINSIGAHCWHHFPWIWSRIISFNSSEIRWPVSSQSIKISITCCCGKAAATVVHWHHMTPLFGTTIVALHCVEVRVTIITTKRIKVPTCW